jgi:hypothetical protein
MAYEKQNFETGQVLEAEHLNHIERGIEALEQGIANLNFAKIGTVTLSASSWEGTANLFSQVVEIEGVTANSQVDLTPSVEQLAMFYEKDLAFVTEMKAVWLLYMQSVRNHKTTTIYR